VTSCLHALSGGKHLRTRDESTEREHPRYVCGDYKPQGQRDQRTTIIRQPKKSTGPGQAPSQKSKERKNGAPQALYASRKEPCHDRLKQGGRSKNLSRKRCSTMTLEEQKGRKASGKRNQTCITDTPDPKGSIRRVGRTNPGPDSARGDDEYYSEGKKEIEPVNSVGVLGRSLGIPLFLATHREKEG